MARQLVDTAAERLAVNPAPQGRPVRPKRSNASRLFGHDIFISFALGPPPRGSHSYASDLARRLRERDFTVFFSEDEAPPGVHLDSTLRGALHRSKTLVVIANRGTLQEPRWVRKEVEEFRRRHPSRPVIAISVGGALQDPTLADEAQQWLEFQDKIWLDETQEALANGIASEALVNRLATAPARLRSNVGWRWVVRGIVASLAILAIALAVAAKMARDSAERARAELRRAVSLRLVAEAQGMLSGARAGGDERALWQLLAANRIAPSAEVDDALLDALVERRDLLELVPVGVPVSAVAVSAAGHRIVSGGGYALRAGKDNDDSLRVWDASTGKQIGAPLEGHESLVLSVALSVDGSRIVSGSADHTVRLWDAQTGKAMGSPLEGHETSVTSVAFGLDGSRVVSGDADNTLRLWDAKTGKAMGVPLEGQAFAANEVAISADGSHIVVPVWNSTDDGGWGALTSRALSPDGSRIVSATYVPGESSAVSTPATLQMWDVRTGQRIAGPMTGHVNPVRTLAFSPDGQRIVSGSEDHTIRLWDATTSQPLGQPLQGHSGPVNSVVFNHDGSRIVSGSDDGTLRVWNADLGTPIGTVLQTHTTTISSVAFSPDGNRAASGGLDGVVRVWDTRTGKPIGTALEQHDNAVNTLAFSPDGKCVVSGSSDGTLQLWNANTGRRIGAAWRGHLGSVTDVVFSPHQGSFSNTARTGTASPLRSRRMHRNPSHHP